MRVNEILQMRHVIWMTLAACLMFAYFYFRILGKHIKQDYRIIHMATNLDLIVINKICQQYYTVIHLHNRTVMGDITSNICFIRAWTMCN